MDLPPNLTIAKYRDYVFGWDQKDFNETLANTTATFFTVAAFLELLEEGNKRGNFKQKSQVIAISSIGGYSRQPLGVAYQASKAAVFHMFEQLSTLLVPFSHPRKRDCARDLPERDDCRGIGTSAR
ncbi:hypothetical protein LY76DRAFT_589824 [Colletotrichum caudatum]|nr:hypothetical protein LY76DRAFT_589824 [Colletotrichum caudatum]